MNVSDRPEQPEEVDDLPGSDVLRRATAALRAVPLRRAVEIADEVLRRTLAAPRRAELVRSRVDPSIQVSTIAIAAVLRADLDAALPDAAVQRVLPEVDDDGHLATLTLDLLVRYPEAVPEVADVAREVAAASLAGMIGASAVPVSVTHVHVSDITLGDPHVVDPGDE
jgi:hypothetical protein